MRVLVTVATKHGGTLEIARSIGATLGQTGIDTEVVPIEDVTSLERYDAVVLGSAVYMGRWLEPARRFVDRHAATLATRPVWLFSSGPLGDPPRSMEVPNDVAAMVARTHARGHHLFAGILDKGGLDLVERAVVGAVRAPAGDFRAWDEVADWALEIAETLPVPA